MARVRLADVAAEAGVSVSAASLVLNNRPSRISEETAERVREASERLGYTPDINARSLRGRRTKTIGLLSDVVVTTPFATGLVQGVQAAAWQRDHLLLIANSENDAQQERRLVEAMTARRVDAYLYALMYHQKRELPETLQGQVVVGLDVELDGCPSFVPDEVAGAARATRHLVEHGHRRVAHIQGNSKTLASGMRRAAFDEELRGAGIDPRGRSLEMPADGASDADHGFHLTLELMSREERPTAIFAFNDMTAVGVHRALWSLGLSVPGDVSVVGFDNLGLIVDELLPELTSVVLPHREMGRLATDAVIDLVEGRPVAQGVQLVDCPLVVRRSVAPPS